MLTTSLRIAQKALKRNKLRTGLAVLGMTIGVAAVLTMFALGTGAQESVSSDVKSAGTTLIFVRSGNFTKGGEESKIPTGMGSSNSLVADDAAAIGKIDGVKYVSANVKDRTWVETSNQRFYTQVIGADVDYGKAYAWGFPKGKFFKSGDVESAANVAVIGTTLRDHLFGDENPVGKEIQLHGKPYRIVGVFEAKDEDQGEYAVIPYTTAQKMVGTSSIQMVTVSAEQAGETTRISDDIKKLLRGRHHLDSKPMPKPGAMVLGGLQAPGLGGSNPDDFTVKTQASEALTKGLNTSVAAFILANMPQMDQTNSQEMAGTLSRAGSTMTALLAAIATISLIVGGIGIMNIMLVSVTERTREIGIRRAIGARQSDVLQQFLVEAVTLSVFGGVFGIVIGFIASFVITNVLHWPATISITAVALAFGIAAVTGVFFGFYPARRASQLSPIDALRYE
ncbi:MAG: multidrug transporter substrate-binding protein [Acidobacteriaceae bacterium]|nr:multidrug transporter substrate-binding protein [Acidobacteriaceae bacterium]